MSWAPWKERGTVPAPMAVPPSRSVLVEHPGTRRLFVITGYFMVVALWAAFIMALALSTESLHAIWEWFRALDRPFQIAGWIVLLPFAAGLAIWESSWPALVRLTLVLVLALGTIIGYAPKSEE